MRFIKGIFLCIKQEEKGVRNVVFGSRGLDVFRVFQTQMFDNNTFTPHFVTTFLVRGYHISGHKAPPPVLRTPFDGRGYFVPALRCCAPRTGLPYFGV